MSYIIAIILIWVAKEQIKSIHTHEQMHSEKDKNVNLWVHAPDELGSLMH